MFFNSYTSSQLQKRDLIDSFYFKIVNVSRNRAFYDDLLVPDTIDGRFDLLVLFSIFSHIISLTVDLKDENYHKICLTRFFWI